MATTPRLFDPDFYYHIYNCGVEKRDIFLTRGDYLRFLATINYYVHRQSISYTLFQDLNQEAKETYNSLNPTGSATLRTKIIAFCLMPNHFHFVLKLAHENGISRFLSDICNSYTRYFNLKNKRVGRLFQGPFKSKKVSTEKVSTEESLMQLSRYVHLNPVMSSKTNPLNTLKPEDYPFSSYLAWIKEGQTILKNLKFLHQREIALWIKTPQAIKLYQAFVEAKIGKDPTLQISKLLIEDTFE